MTGDLSGRGPRRGLGDAKRAALVAVALFAVHGCGSTDPDTVLRSVSATWRGEDTSGGVRIRLDAGGGALVGIGPDGGVLDSMAVQVQGVAADSGLVHLRRPDTDASFTVKLLDPASDGRSRIVLSFPDGQDLHLVFQKPLGAAASAGGVSDSS